MAIVMRDDYKAQFLEEERAFLNTLTLVLFTNNTILSGSTVVGSLVQPTDSGYSAVTNVGFTTPTVSGGRGVIEAPPVTFNFSHSAGNFNVEGYAFLDPANSNQFVFGENRSSPLTITSDIDSYTVTPHKEMDDL